MPFRQVIFWIHLICGVVAGIVIGVMSFTAAALAFEKQIIAWAEQDARRVTPPTADAKVLPLEELAARLREKFPEARPASIVVTNDPHEAVSFSLGRAGAYYVDPYTGDVRQADASRVRGFMSLMIRWHRYFGLSGEQQPLGKAINGACNLAFLGLAITGIYIWFPRSWSWRAFRPVVWFNGQWRGRPRDWNWHNVIGFWSAPVLIVLTATALPISYGWAGNLINTLAGTPPAAGGGRGAAAAVAAVVPAPPEGAQPLAQDGLLARVREEMPQWSQITMRTGAPVAGRGGAGATGAGGRGGAATEGRGRGGAGGGRATETPASSGPQAASFTVRESGTWPRTATTTIALDPFTGAVLQKDGYAQLPAARQVRAWTRFLHTGEALGLPGQFVAGVASFGGVILMYTGLALAWRRFFGRRGNVSAAGSTKHEPAAVAAGDNID